MSLFAESYILTGPTGSGKSAFALELAEAMNAEILSMDSMTLYRGMDIGTAKPGPEERHRVPHHLIDVLDPWESANVAWWLQEAGKLCQEIRARGKRCLFVGGTPFYLKSLLFGLFESPATDHDLRKRLEQEAEEQGKLHLHERLRQVDPRTAQRLHPNDVRRVVRALEVHALTGRPISEFQQTWNTEAFGGKESDREPCISYIVLDMPREFLYKRINERVCTMLELGWLQEADRLKQLSRPVSREASQALGYSELWDYIERPNRDWSEVVDTIQLRTRQFAKRQLTWFRQLKGFRLDPRSADRMELAKKQWKW